MRVRHNKHDVRATGRARRGFTLVELMLVMFILSVLVALTVGVSWYVIEQGRKTETLNNQRRLMAAVDAYRKATNKLPYIRNTGDVDYNPNSSRPYDYDPDDHMTRLLKLLRGEYPRDNAVYEATKAMLGEGAGSLTSDAYGNSMVFLSNKGVGGNPVVISAGPDGVLGYERNLTEQQRQQYKKDNVYSDTSN